MNPGKRTRTASRKASESWSDPEVRFRHTGGSGSRYWRRGVFGTGKGPETKTLSSGPFRYVCLFRSTVSGLSVLRERFLLKFEVSFFYRRVCGVGAESEGMETKTVSTGAEVR